MHRDPSLRKRNALVIPGVLLVLLCLTGIVYAQMLRSDDVTCEDGRQVFFLNACRSATLLLVIPLALGAVLIGVGASMRSDTECHLGHGTAATTGLAVLIAAALLPALVGLGLSSMEDPESPYVLTRGEVDYGLPLLLYGAAGLGLLLLVPYLALYIGTARPLACCRERSCFDPCYCDEVAAPVPTFPASDARPDETAQVTTSPWPAQPGTRSRATLAPISAPLVPAEAPPALPPPEPDAPQPDAWPTPTQDFATPFQAPPPAEEPAEKASETQSDAWPAASAPPSDPWPATPKTEEVWTPPAPVDVEEPKQAKGSAAKGKSKTAHKAAKDKAKPAHDGEHAPKKKTRKVSGKKKQ